MLCNHRLYFGAGPDALSDDDQRKKFKTLFDEAMKAAKSWSDFLGFHVRISFVFLISLVALLPAIVAFMLAFDGDGEYDVRQFWLEILVFLFSLSLAGVMLWKIAWVVFSYFRARNLGFAGSALLTATIVAVDLFMAVVIFRASYTQALNLHHIPLAEADRIGREILKSYGW